jgi:hypothetical protein
MARFAWGRVLDRFEYDFDGRKLELTKFHPWVSENGHIRVGTPNTEEVQYHCEELSESAHSVEYMVLAWIARRKLGLNQHMLVAGLARALDLK